MVFDYADNGSLREYLSTPAIKLYWSDNCLLSLDIVKGLKYIHRIGILHKDLVSFFFKHRLYIEYCFFMLPQVFKQCINSWKNG